MPEHVQRFTNVAESTVDALFKWIPRTPLSADEWSRVRMVAHRGCVSQSRSIYENTLASFEAAQTAGAWGIEFDVQWTLDDWPVVIHDPHTAGLPGSGAVEVSQTEFDELRSLCPLVPTLEEVLDQFAGKMHLMIELKGQVPGSKAGQRLRECLNELKPGADFHLMSLEPISFRALEGFPDSSKLLIATTNTRLIFKEFKKGGFGGLTGHFLLLNQRMRDFLEQFDAPWGTGFVNSMNLLAREIRSGATWVFSDAADKLLLNRQ